MTRHHMWFGTKERMAWVPCPAINVGMSSEGAGESGTYMGGGGYARNSADGHMVYEFSWNANTRDEIYPIADYGTGVYGDGLIYFLDPFAMDTNVLPERWAAPGKVDRWSAYLREGTTPPTVTNTGANTLGLPVKTAQYAISDNGRELWVPVPPGHTLHFAWVGSASGASVQVNGVAATPTAVGASGLTWNTYTADATIRLWGTGTVDIAGMVAQVLPTGQAPTTNGWVSGRGHSGCRFQGRPKVVGLSAALDRVSARATLIETGDWEK